jgi:hypothetical protein
MTKLAETRHALWIAEGATVSFYGFAYPTRSVMIRLANGDLWIWSPIDLTPDLKSAIDKLGPVTHLVSPNKLHHIYLRSWATAYPQAKLWGPASIIRKRPDLQFQPPLEDEAPIDWRGQIAQVLFRGSFLLDEMEFYHPASRTVIIADMSQNFSKQFVEAYWSWWQRPMATVSKITNGNGYAPVDLRLSCLRRRAAQEAIRQMLQWNPERVIIAHGDGANTNGQEYLRRAFQWLIG